jgi:hypothetical protein
MCISRIFQLSNEGMDISEQLIELLRVNGLLMMVRVKLTRMDNIDLRWHTGTYQT